jgi:hypothetical protein
MGRFTHFTPTSVANVAQANPLPGGWACQEKAGRAEHMDSTN